MRGRIEESLSEQYTVLSYPKLINNYHRMFQEMMWANKAHAIMLYDVGVNDLETSKDILSAVGEIQKTLKEGDLAIEKGDDLYLNVEHAIRSKAGGEKGGKLHIGRSRNDLYSCLSRMVVRKDLWDTMDLTIELQETLLLMAKEHTDSVMTGYTHMQPAQPTTLAHYLTSYISVLSRDFNRMRECYVVTNINPLGGAAFAGTGFPLDRQQTTNLLGFDAMLVNTWDGVASRDFIMQAEAAYAIMQNTLSRFAQDLYIWCTNEFAMWDLGGQVSGQSSIMPQKKNPSALEEVKANSSSGLSAFTASFASLKNASFSFVLDEFNLDVDFASAQKSMTQALRMIMEIIKYSSFNKERALRMSEKNFCTVTGLADYLVREYNVSFRDAHHITGGMVADAVKAGLDVTGMDMASAKKWTKEILGKELALTDGEVKRELEPISNVASKQVVGGPSKTRVEEMIADQEKTMKEEHQWLLSAVKQVDDAYAETEKKVIAILQK